MGIFHPVSKSVTDTNSQLLPGVDVGDLEAAVRSRLSPDQQEFPQMWKLDVKIVTSRIFRVTSLCQIQFNLYLRAPGGLKLEIEHFYVSTRWLGCLAAWLAQYAVLVEQETVPLLHTMLGQYSAESTNTSLQSLGDHSNIKHASKLYQVSRVSST